MIKIMPLKTIKEEGKQETMLKFELKNGNILHLYEDGSWKEVKDQITPENQESWEPTEAQKKYWDSMKGKRGNLAPRWKGEAASVSAFHKWIAKHYGSPKTCENPNCKGKGKWFDWCLKTGRKHSHDREDYIRLCRSCHRAYDLTPEKKAQAEKNLWWSTGKRLEWNGIKDNLWFHKDKNKTNEHRKRKLD